MIEHFYQNHPGNFTFPDVYTFLADRFVRSKPLVGVEIGVANGRSAAYLAVELLNKGHIRPRLNLVDNSHGNLNAAVAALAPVASQMEVGVLCGNSWDMAAAFEDGELDFVFIDGEHEYSAVKKDIAAWLPKVRIDGIIAGHDYVHEPWSGVIPAVTEAFDVVEVWRGIPWEDGKRYPSWLVKV